MGRVGAYVVTHPTVSPGKSQKLDGAFSACPASFYLLERNFSFLDEQQGLDLSSQQNNNKTLDKIYKIMVQKTPDLR